MRDHYRIRENTGKQLLTNSHTRVISVQQSLKCPISKFSQRKLILTNKTQIILHLKTPLINKISQITLPTRTILPKPILTPKNTPVIIKHLPA